MKITFGFVVFYVSYGAVLVCATGPYKNTIEWYTSGSADLPIDSPEPVGMENGNNLFLCRVQIDGHILPGKRLSDNHEFGCILPYNHRESFPHRTYEKLYTFPGSTSWVKFNGYVNENMVKGGHVDGVTNYLCRAMVNGLLLPGWLDTRTAKLYCKLGFGGVEYSLDDMNNVEVLVRNAFGQKMRTSLPT